MILKVLKSYNLYIAVSFTAIILVLYYAHQPQDLSQGVEQDLPPIIFRTKDPKRPPVIVQPRGGLGNQMFQFAAAYSLARKRNSELYLCLASNWESSVNSDHLTEFHAADRSYLLWTFSILYDNIIIANEFGCTKMTNFSGIGSTEMYFVNENTILNSNVPLDKALYLTGYFESEIFFKPHESEIIRQLSLKSKIREQLENSINDFASIILSTTDSVAIHVRRRDFILPNRLIPISYYKDAMNRMKREIGETKKITFFVFSDDAVEVDFRDITENFVFVSNKDLSRLADFMLMTMCKHIIVANSTFSWWTAYLNGNRKKIIIAPLPRNPQEWTDNHNFNELFTEIYGGNLSYPQKWITINPFNNG